MSVSSWINFRVNKPQSSVSTALQFLLKSKWLYFNNGYVQYLPLGDKGDFLWQHNKLTDSELQEILEKKWMAKEDIGLLIIHQEGDSGGELLLKIDGTISFSLSFNLYGSNSPRLCLEKISINANELLAKFARFR